MLREPQTGLEQTHGGKGPTHYTLENPVPPAWIQNATQHLSSSGALWSSSTMRSIQVPRPRFPAAAALLGLALCALPCRAAVEGLRGLTMPTEDPACAFACTGSLAGFALACSTEDHGDHGGGHGHGSPVMTMPSCRAVDEPYLTTVAWCMSTKCADFAVPISRLEEVWELEITGDPSVPAKWSYTEALLHVDRPPTRTLVDGDQLNLTSLAPASWQVSYNTATVMDHESRTQSIYGCVSLSLRGFPQGPCDA